ncbi:MAG TPA: glycoside hydrolase family 9 protein, partial [Verrucomicrobiae bacterium]
MSATRRQGLWVFLMLTTLSGYSAEVFIRANQLGYRPPALKIAIAFSTTPLPREFVLTGTNSVQPLFKGKLKPINRVRWGQFDHHGELNFSAWNRPGTYKLRVGDGECWPFVIDEHANDELPDQLLEFMREQRCGYNPWLDAVCHSSDGRTAYGPLSAGSFIDARGGWHDAADLLKYLLTSGNATAQMLLAFELRPKAQVPSPESKVESSKTAREDPEFKKEGFPAQGLFADEVDSAGKPGGNGVPDVLDEARWGLEWMLKLHPAPDQLYHQVADDRDHIGRRLPQNDTADYGWGKGGARVVYCADGQPQGLQQYQSASTGIANLAGRYAAAMGLAYQVLSDDPRQRDFARRCLRAGEEVYALGRAKEGVQQGNSYRAPYRYEETTWADDME